MSDRTIPNALALPVYDDDGPYVTYVRDDHDERATKVCCLDPADLRSHTLIIPPPPGMVAAGAVLHWNPATHSPRINRAAAALLAMLGEDDDQTEAESPIRGIALVTGTCPGVDGATDLLPHVHEHILQIINQIPPRPAPYRPNPPFTVPEWI